MCWSISPGSEPLEAGLPTADIIPFPARSKPPEPRPQDRLARAMDSLNAALSEQRAALAVWRETLNELKSTTAGLGKSLQNYRSNLELVGDRVSALNTRARSLERWADSVIAE